MKQHESILEQNPGLSLSVRVRANLLHLLYHQSYPAVYSSLIAAILLFVALWGQVNHGLLIGWMTCILISVFMRIALFWFHQRCKPNDLQILDWELPYAITIFVPALVWGLGVLWIMTESTLLYQVVEFIFLLGLGGGAASVYSARRYMATGAMACVMLPATIWLLLQGEITQFSLAMASVLFMLVMVRTSSVLSVALSGNYMLTHRLTLAKQNSEQLAQTDFLTGLDNRRAFFEHGQTLVNYCERNQLPLCVLMVDADHFKQINDEYGHAVGDKVLQHLAVQLRGALRKSDLCGRMGGEEFALLLPDTPIEQATALAERFCQSYAASPLRYEDVEITNTVSIGVASDGYDIDHLLHCADGMLYQAKAAGRNRVVAQTCASKSADCKVSKVS